MNKGEMMNKLFGLFKLTNAKDIADFRQILVDRAFKTESDPVKQVKAALEIRNLDDNGVIGAINHLSFLLMIKIMWVVTFWTVIPIAVIATLNTLFNTAIDMNFVTWLSTFFLLITARILFRGRKS